MSMALIPNLSSSQDSFHDQHFYHKLSTVELATPYNTWQVVILALIAGCTSLITIGGNLIVILSFFLERSIRQPSNYFIASLAVSDLLIGVCSMPLYTTYILTVKNWPLGEVLCDLWLSIDYTACLCSIYTVFCITMDRFCSIKLPAKYRVWRTEKKVITIVCLTWIIPISVFFTSIFGWQYFAGRRTVPDRKCYVQYMEDALFNCLLQIGYFWITLTAMFVLYSGIYKVALDLHRRSEAKRKKQISCLTTMAQKTVGQLGTAVITMTRNPKLDAACLVSNRPPSLSPLMKDTTPWDLGAAFGLSPSPDDGGVSKEARKENDGKNSDCNDSDSETDSSQEESFKTSDQKEKNKKKRRLSLLGINDLRSLIPRPRQFLELPTPCVVDDCRPASIAVCDRETDSENECTLRPIYTKQFEKRFSRDCFRSEPASNCGISSELKGDFKSTLHEGEITLRVPAISPPTYDSCLIRQSQYLQNPPTSNPIKPVIEKVSKNRGKDKAGAVTAVIQKKRQLFASRRYLKETCMSLDQGLARNVQFEGKPQDSSHHWKEYHFTEHCRPPEGNMDGENQEFKQYIRKYESNTSEPSGSNRTNSQFSKVTVPKICFHLDSPHKVTDQTHNESGEKAVISNIRRNNKIQIDATIKNDPEASIIDFPDYKEIKLPKLADNRTNVSLSSSQENEVEEEIWILAKPEVQTTSNGTQRKSVEFKESCFSAGDNFENPIIDQEYGERYCESQQRKSSSISVTASLSPCDTISIKTINFDLSPTQPELATSSPLRVLTGSPKPCREGIMDRLKVDDPAAGRSSPRLSGATSTPRHSISPSSSALAFWNLISRATRFGSADNAETQEQRRLRKQQKKHENRARKALRTITIILGAFVFCWTPWHILSMIMGFCGDKERCVAPVLYDISYWLCYLNSPINPFCYAFANHQFKKTFLRILRLDWRRS